MIRYSSSHSKSDTASATEQPPSSASASPAAGNAAKAKQSNSLAPEDLAIKILAYLARNPQLLERFLALSGIDPSQLRRAAQNRGFAVGVLSFLLNNERDLLDFCEAAQLKPQAVAAAFAQLSQGGGALC